MISVLVSEPAVWIWVLASDIVLCSYTLGMCALENAGFK